MNVSTLLPFPPCPMYYPYFLSGVEWSQRTIGGDEMLVRGARYDLGWGQGFSTMECPNVQLVNSFLPAHPIIPHGLLLCIEIAFCL